MLTCRAEEILMGEEPIRWESKSLGYNESLGKENKQSGKAI